jgi:peptidoglycan/LPS O-acetylase OafA/YrhL
MGLGWLRLILSLMVIDAHYGGFRELLQPAIVNHFGVDSLAYVGEGGIAVTGFFVISGYVIAYVLGRKYDAHSWRGIGVFYLGRALRIYPLYLLVLAATWGALAASGGAPSMGGLQVLNNLSLVPYGVLALFADHNRFGPMQLSQSLLIGPAWTLALDLLLYLMAPFLLVRKRAAWSAWLLGLGYFAAFIVLGDPRPPVWFGYFYSSALPYLFAFAAGALVFHYRGHFAPGKRARTVAAAALVVLTYFPLGLTSTALNQLLAVGAFAVLVAGFAQHRPGRWDRFVGDLTYATYLLHVPLLSFAERAGASHPAGVALGLTYLLATLLLFSFEYPLDRLRDATYRRLSHSGHGPQTVHGPTADSGARYRTGLVVAPTLLLLIVAAGAGYSLWRNLWHGGAEYAVTPTSCPSGWRCQGGVVQVHGAGVVELQPELPLHQRIVVDLRNQGRLGDIFAGLERRQGQTLRLGIMRSGQRCHLVFQAGTLQVRDPAGWNTACGRVHRLVLDGSDGHLVAAVDSIWVVGTGQPAAEPVHLVVAAGPQSVGVAEFRDVFSGGMRQPRAAPAEGRPANSDLPSMQP